MIQQGDFRIIASLLRGNSSRSKAASHEEALTGFYASQAQGYDAFRERLLHGREQLLRQLPIQAGSHWAEIGGGTGKNLEFLGSTRERAARISVVDLCQPLLAVAEQRAQQKSWDNVETVHADATTWQAPQALDGVWFSYSLTMIPDWRAALMNAIEQLRPGGIIAVVDFYISAAQAQAQQRQHTRWQRWFWPRWFGHDGVWLNPEHLQCLQQHSSQLLLSERTGVVPWMLGARAPYYLYIGTKR